MGHIFNLAERARFELAVPFSTLVFKTSLLNHLSTSPNFTNYIEMYKRPYVVFQTIHRQADGACLVASQRFAQDKSLKPLEYLSR